MDVRALISMADSLFPNVCPFAVKAYHLYQLDRKIYSDFLFRYGGFNCPDVSAASSPDRPLLAPEEFSGMYLYYLFMQLELTSGNVTGYQNQAALFNRAYLSFMSWVNRTHLQPPVKIYT